LPSARYPEAARRSLERFSTVSSITSRPIHASGILYSEDAPPHGDTIVLSQESVERFGGVLLHNESPWRRDIPE
jgi:hypothetical protein